MTLFSDWLIVIAVGMIAIITPGPDFALTLRSSLVHSRRAGIYTAVGVGVGNSIHTTYSLIGIGAIISQSILLFSLLKWAGALYLIYLGVQSLRAKEAVMFGQGNHAPQNISRWAAFRIGLFGNLLNPKATLFFLALFTQVVRPTTPIALQAIYGFTVAALSLVWFALVATVISRKGIKARILSISYWLERITGAALVFLGIRLAITEARK